MTDIRAAVPKTLRASSREEAWAKLPSYIADHGGYEVWDVDMLVHFEGAQRAGARIVERIEQRLAANNIGHLPARLPTDGTCRVLLYNRDRPNIGYILRLVHDLATQDVGDSTNPSVLQLQSLLDAQAKVQQAIANKAGGGARG